MYLRVVPPVYSPVRLRSAVRALGALLLRERASGLPPSFERWPEDRRILLTDSGSTALMLALSRNRDSSVALPAYCCPDVGAAALTAGCRIHLYDVDPTTLHPDWDSLRTCLEHGARQIVIAHLFGRIADMGPARDLAAQYGASLVEDAAQGASGSWRGIPAGMLADVSVVSFGRGKGLNAGGGGALSVSPEVWRTRWHEQWPPLRASNFLDGVKAFAKVAATELFSHPRLYAWPSQFSPLGIGDTVYRELTAASAPTVVTVRLIEEALRGASALAAERRCVEAWYYRELEGLRDILPSPPSTPEQSGALRFPIRLDPRIAASFRRFGVVRSYPRTLSDYPQITPHIEVSAKSYSGAVELARTLHTLPTHSLLSDSDRIQLVGALLIAHDRDGSRIGSTTCL